VSAIVAKDRYLKHLATVPMFAHCTKKELTEIASLATPLYLEPGDTFIKEGAAAHEMMIIVEGSATVRKKGRKVATLGAGDVVGELAVLAHRERNASVTSDSKMEILVIDQRSMDALLDDVKGLAKKLLKVVVARLDDGRL